MHNSDRTLASSLLSEIKPIYRFLWVNLRMIGIPSVLVFLLALAYLHTSQDAYTTSLKVIPQDARFEEAGAFSNVAPLIGVDISTSPSARNFELFLSGLTSLEVANHLANNQKLLKQMFPNQWDSDSKSWIEPENTLISFKKFLKFVLAIYNPTWAPPDALDVQNYLSENIDITKNRGEFIVTISHEHKDPDFSIALLAEIVDSVNTNLREKQILQLGRQIEYLKLRSAEETDAALKRAFFDILLAKEKEIALVMGQLNFAADSFGQPIKTLFPTSPQPKVLLLVAIVFGAILGLLLALIREQIKQSRTH